MALTRAARAPLGVFPTPLHPAPTLGAIVGVEHLWLKRDDLSGFVWGGNKVRTAEFLIGHARENGVTDLVASGGPTSNFTAILAAAARTADIAFHQVAFGSEPAGAPPALLAGRAAGARVTFTGSADRSTMEVVAEEIAAELAAAGRRPVVVPRGGANEVGANGFVAAAAELQAQLSSLGIASATLVVPVGSGGTITGLLAGRSVLQADWTIHGPSVSRPPAELLPAVLARAVATARAVAEANSDATAVSPPPGTAPLDPADGRASVASNDPRRDDGASVAMNGPRMGSGVAKGLELHDCRGEGFGVASPAETKLAHRISDQTGLLVDPTYNAKALHWLANQRPADQGPANQSLVGTPEHPIIYWHTGGLLATLPRAEQTNDPI